MNSGGVAAGLVSPHSENGFLFCVNKDGLIGNSDPEVDYVEKDPRGRYVRVIFPFFYSITIICGSRFTLY